MSVLIKGMEMPKNCHECRLYEGDIYYCSAADKEIDILDSSEGKCQFCPLVPVPQHGRLIDADALRAKMYHEAFETDTPMQKWDNGCWIRYKMFEKMEESALTIIPAEEGE